uniref:Exportin-T n=1 Tax=Kalanchoe fedtschenkoi TaxID=63787 RepID=A0A7N0TYM0_KALFE
MDDLERAILISFDESGAVDSALKLQALAFCQQVKEAPTAWQICIERLGFTKLPQVQFWCLQCLYEVVSSRYAAMSSEEKAFVRESVFKMVCYEPVDEKNLVRVLDAPGYVRNKLAQVLATLVKFEYPVVWSGVFVDLLPHLSKGVELIDMFCRVLNRLDAELIDAESHGSDEVTTLAVASRVKDAMRQQCVPQIVRVWYEVVSSYKNSNSEICIAVLECMRKYIAWIDIGLIANDVFVPLLFDLVLGEGLDEQLRGAAASCLLAVVSKGMNFQSKLALLQSLRMNRIFSLVSRERESEFKSKVAILLAGYGAEILLCFVKLNSEEARGVSMELLEEVLPSVLRVMQNCEADLAIKIVEFLSGYVDSIKSLSPTSLSEKQLVHVGQILEMIRMHICYDPDYRHNVDVLDKIGQEEEDRMSDIRKDLFSLLRNVGRVAPEVTQIFIHTSLVNAVSSPSEKNVEEVEAALSIFYALGESISEEAMKNGNGFIGKLVPMLLSTKFQCHSNRIVALIYLETIMRYTKYVQENTQYIPMVLTVFLDDRGIRHPNVSVSRRASYLFMRVVKQLKANLVPFIEQILQIWQSLQDKIAQFTLDISSKEFSGYEDGSHIFEAIGILAGMEDVPLEKQSEYLSALLTPLCQQVQTLLMNAQAEPVQISSTHIAIIQQNVMAINALSKGFSERLATSIRPTIGLMFKQTLDVLLQILVVFPDIEPLRNKVTSFLHCMVGILGPAVIPYLPKALDQLLNDCEGPKEMGNFLILINQLTKFRTSILDIMEEVFPIIVGRIFSVLPSDPFPTGPGSNTEEIRELLNLQKTFYAFLHLMATNELSSVLISPKSRVYLDQIMQFLLSSSRHHKDISVRKSCVQIFVILIKEWYATPHCEEKVPGFRNFIMERFATDCCLYSVLEKSFNLHDAATDILFGEIVTAQKVMYEKFGDDFLNHLLSRAFPATQCPQNYAEQYCQKLQTTDFKALKSFYKSLVENLKSQQNGSLVFR